MIFWCSSRLASTHNPSSVGFIIDKGTAQRHCEIVDEGRKHKRGSMESKKHGRIASTRYEGCAEVPGIIFLSFPERRGPHFFPVLFSPQASPSRTYICPKNFLESTTIKDESDYRLKRHVTVIHHTTTTKQRSLCHQFKISSSPESRPARPGVQFYIRHPA